MKLPKLDLVCGAFDTLRPVFSFVKVTKEFTYATDAHSLVKHKTSELFDKKFCESIPDAGLLIPARAIKEIRKTSTLKIEYKEGKLELIRKGEFVGNIIFTLPKEGTYSYPNVELTIPKKEDIKPLSKIGISADLLSNTSQAMGIDNSQVRMEFTGTDKPIILTSNDYTYPSVLAILMPYYIAE